VRRVKEEAETIGFGIGFASFVAGVAMITVPGAFILGGLLFCGLMVALALAKQRKRRQAS